MTLRFVVEELILQGYPSIYYIFNNRTNQRLFTLNGFHQPRLCIIPEWNLFQTPNIKEKCSFSLHWSPHCLHRYPRYTSRADL